MFRELAWNDLPQPMAVLVASLTGILRALEKESKDTHLKRRGTGVREGGRKQTGSFVLRVFICFLKAAILGEVSGKDLNRIFISFPGVFFNMFH